MVSDSYRQAVNAFYKTTFKTANNPDEDMPIERQFIYDNPICFGEESLFSALMKFESWGKPPIPPAFMFALR